MQAPGPAYELFRGVPREAVARLVAGLPLHTLPAGTRYVREGGPPCGLCLVEQGTLAVWKGEPNTASGVEIARVHAGGCIGEMDALRPGRSGVSIAATTEVRLRELRMEQLPDAGGVRQTVALNLARIIAHRLSQTDAALRRTHDLQLKTTRLVGATAAYVNWNMVLLGAAMFSLPVVKLLDWGHGQRALLSLLFIAAAALIALLFVRRNQVERSVLGLTFTRRRHQVRTALQWTMPLLIVGFVAKVALAGRTDAPWFDPFALPRQFGYTSPLAWGVLAGVVVAGAAALGFIRCAIQGSLSFFFRTSDLRADWAAVAASSVLCAALQIHVGIAFAWVNFLLGLFWGSLFARERSFFAAFISHAGIALWMLLVLGVPV